MKKKILSGYLFILLILLALYGGLGIMDLRGEEPRRALVAWEMIHQDNYLQPTIQGLPYYNKPPVFNWVVTVFFQLLGPHNWVLRLPSLLALLAMAFLHYRFVQKEVNQALAQWSTIFLLTGAHFLFFATVLSGELDLFYALFVYAQALSIYYFYQRRQWWPLFFISYGLMSLGFLIKGLPSIAFQGLTLLGWAFAQKSWRWFFSWAHLFGGLFSLLLIGSYFYVYDQTYGNGWLYLINLLEEASQKSAAEGSWSSILKQLVDFPLQFLIDYLPWSLLLYVYFRKGTRALLKQHPFLIFTILFFAVNIWLYWISPGARSRYLYPFAPFFLTPLAYLYLQKPILSYRWLWVLVLSLAGLRIVYNYTVMPHQQRTMENIQLYRTIAEDALEQSKGASLYTCCQQDTIWVNPSLAGYTLVEDTIFIPMYLPYQIPFYIQREREELIPFRQKPDQPGYYLSTDTLVGPPLRSYSVWDDKTLYLFEVK